MPRTSTQILCELIGMFVLEIAELRAAVEAQAPPQPAEDTPTDV